MSLMLEPVLTNMPEHFYRFQRPDMLWCRNKQIKINIISAKHCWQAGQLKITWTFHSTIKQYLYPIHCIPLLLSDLSLPQTPETPPGHFPAAASFLLYENAPCDRDWKRFHKGRKEPGAGRQGRGGEQTDNYLERFKYLPENTLIFISSLPCHQQISFATSLSFPHSGFL